MRRPDLYVQEWLEAAPNLNDWIDGPLGVIVGLIIAYIVVQITKNK